MLRSLILALTAFALSGCTGVGGLPFGSNNAAGYRTIDQKQCVPYARSVSGIQLYGDAYTWWTRAEPRYRRGHWPTPGAVMVLSRTPRMTHGHLAVVTNVINPREIDVTHSNWGSDWMSRRMVYKRQRVQDVSLHNDWTMVRFWNYDAGTFGFPYAADGFIYR